MARSKKVLEFLKRVKERNSEEKFQELCRLLGVDPAEVNAGAFGVDSIVMSYPPERFGDTQANQNGIEGQLSAEYQRDGAIETEADFCAAIRKKKQELGQPVTADDYPASQRQPAGLSAEYQKDGTIMNAVDFAADIKRTKIALGQEVN